MDEEDQLLLKWDDHHKSFFSLASELMDREELIDVTLITGDSSFPAHKLILSICSPYFRSLFVRNPCSHPMVVLKDVEAKYLRLLLIYMYEGQVACPSAELSGLLATAKSLQIRGLLELEKKRRRATSSSDDHSSSTSGIIHNNNNILVEEETLIKTEQSSPLDMHVDERSSPSLQAYAKPNHDSSIINNNSHHNQHNNTGSNASSNGLNYTTKGGGGGTGQPVPPSSNMLPPNALDPSDPMASMNALLAAAASQQVQQNHQIVSSGDKSNSKSDPNNSTSASNEINQAAAMANLQLYYYMQKVAGIGNGSPSSTPSSSSPKERKECHVCGKTLYDRSTWNRHMRIHTGEKPYPCRFCGRRFRTNYNKLGHEKKCPDRHNGEGADGGGERGSAPPSSTNNNNKKNNNNTSSSNNNNNNASVTIS